MPKQKFILIYDALCAWSKAFVPVVEKLIKEQIHPTEIRWVSGQWIVADTQEQWKKELHKIQLSFLSSKLRTGADAFEASSCCRSLEGSTIQNSEVPGKAMLIMQNEHPEYLFSFLQVLQNIFFDQAQCISTALGLKRALQHFPVESEAFIDQVFSIETHALWLDHQNYYEQLGATSFPTLLIEKEDGRLHILAKGYTTLEQLRSKLHMVQCDEERPLFMKN